MFLSGFSRSRNSFSRSPAFSKHVRFTLFASSGSHRHTSLENPVPKAMAVIFHCIHFLSILISPSHPCHSQLPPPKIPFRGHGLHCPRPPPQRRPPAAVGPRGRGRFALPCAATSSLGAPAEVADAEGPVSCMVRWFFPIRNDAKAMEKSLLVWPTGLGSTGKPALTSNLYQQIPNLSCPSHIHPCPGPVFGPKVGANIVT